MQNILKSKIFISAILAVAAVAAAVVVAVNVNHSGIDLQAQLDLGKKYVSELDYENAVIAYEEALEIDPYCLDAYLGLSDAYMALGQQDKAIAIMEQAKNMLPDSVEVYISLAQLYASQDQIGLVVSTLEAGIQATDSDRLREMLREYQPGEEGPVQVQNSQETGNGEEESESAEQSGDDEDREAPSLVIGLEQDNRNQNPAPVLVVSREDEEPVRIPLVAPAPQPVTPAGNESLENGMGSDESHGDSQDSSTGSDGGSSDGGTGSDEGNNGGGTGDDSGATTEPVIPRTGITGNIYGIDGQGIEGVTVTIYSGQSEEPVLVNTDTIGKYLQELAAGTYRIVLSKDGYADLSTSVSVLNDVLTSSSYIMLTEEESHQSASLKGVAINAIDSQNVEGATVVLLGGYDNASNGNQSVIAGSSHTTTGSDGRFSIDEGVTAGYYTVEVSKDGYSTYNHNETIKPGENELNISMSPVIQTQGEYRIVLTWGENPRDLDSHLICSGNDNYHVYFGHKNSGDGNASLDWDDTSSYGPETTTVKVGEGNSYIYAVHNYTNGGARPGESGAWNLANSGARVVVYGGDGIIFEGNVPVNEEGTTWEVFRIENGRLVVKNNVVFEHPRDLADDSSQSAARNERAGTPAALSLTEDKEAVPVEEAVVTEEAGVVESAEPDESGSEENTESAGAEAEEAEPEEAGTEESTEPGESEIEESAEPEEAETEESAEPEEAETEESTEPEEAETEESAEPEEAETEESVEPEETETEESTEPEEAETEETAEPGENETEEEAGAEESGTAGSEEDTVSKEAGTEENAEQEDCLKPEEDGLLPEEAEAIGFPELEENSGSEELAGTGEIETTSEITEEISE